MAAGLPVPRSGTARTVDEAMRVAGSIGYPVIVRPSFVIGGLAIDFCYSPDDLVRQLAAAPEEPLVAEFGPHTGPHYGRLGRGVSSAVVDDTPWVARAHGRERLCALPFFPATAWR